MVERFTEIEPGARMRVLEQGSGKPILFVHGWPTNASPWRPQLEALSGDHRVLAIDLRGFGESTPPPNPTMALLAADVKRFIDVEGLSDVILIGWSMGGCVVMSYCGQFGRHGLRGIGIVDVSPKLWPADDWRLGEGTPFSPEAQGGAWIERWKTDPRSVAHEVYTIGFKDPEKFAAERDRLVEESLKANREAAASALRDAWGCDFRPVLPTIEVPALLLYGAASTSTTPYVREYMERTIRDATLVVFDESSHCMMIEEREKFDRAVDEFAKRV